MAQCPYKPRESGTMAYSKPPHLRPTASAVLQRQYEVNRGLLSDEKSILAARIAYRGDHLGELRRAARTTNNLIRSHYGDFIHEVGRNLYPLIVFTDYEADGPCGVGSTLTLYREDGSVTKVSPALRSNYELFKVCGHLLMGLAVEVGPYLANASLCRGDFVGYGRSGNGSNQVFNSAGFAEFVPWRASLSRYLEGVRGYQQALIRAVEAEAAAEEESMEERQEVGTQEEKNEEKRREENEKIKRNSSYCLPQPEMLEAMLAAMTSVINFCESCLSSGVINAKRWETLNKENFPRNKLFMKAAVKAQADACVSQIKQWRDLMGPEEWRELYVVIPTVWAVSAENPRKTMFQHLMDPDRVESHIITTEWPRDHEEAKTLLGRVVGDRSIGRFVFGDETRDQQIKTIALSSEVDVVQDDALPAIWDAMRKNSCPVRPN